MQEQERNDLSICPSFNSYSSDRLAEIAAGVSDEYCKAKQNHAASALEDVDDEENDDDFEFALADEIYCDRHLRPVFPIFNRNLAMEEIEQSCEIDTSDDTSSIRIPLKNLFLQEREPPAPSSCSSSEADELESVPPGTYCVWRPKLVESSPSQCKKSNSTGSASRRWRLRDLLRRSNSDGKDSFVFLTPKSRHEISERIEKVAESSMDKRYSGQGNLTAKAKTKVAGGSDKKPLSSSAHEAFYVRNRALKEGDKRKSYLPYRRDLLGFFANVHNMGRTFPPL